MVVVKFGGSSVATAAAIGRVATIVAAERRPCLVVVSALGGVTDQLLEVARLAGAGARGGAERLLDEIRDRHRAVAADLEAGPRREALLKDLDDTWRRIRERVDESASAAQCPPAGRDAIVACGELASSRLVAATLEARGLRAAWVDARRVVVTDGSHGAAAPDAEATRERAHELLRPRLETGEIPVVGGFIGATPDGVTTTIGRGGSDYSASLLGACLQASEIQIWTDTDGVLTADPRVLPRAQTVARLSYGEAAALAHFGAKVLHPSTIAPAAAAGIPVRVLNSGRPARVGSLITADRSRRAGRLAGLSWRAGLSLIQVEAASPTARTSGLAALVAACARAGATIHQVSVSDTGLSLLIDSDAAAGAIAESAAGVGRVERHDRLATIAVVGDGLARDPELGAAVLRAIGRVPLRHITLAPGACYLAVTVAGARLARLLPALHQRFFERRDGARANGIGAHNVLRTAGSLPSAQESWS